MQSHALQDHRLQVVQFTAHIQPVKNCERTERRACFGTVRFSIYQSDPGHTSVFWAVPVVSRVV